MDYVVLLEWPFSPADYFEEPVTVTRQDYALTIANGKAIAELGAVGLNAEAELRARIHESLKNRFAGAQLVSHKVFDLCDPRTIHQYPNGTRKVFIDLHDEAIFSESMDLQAIDKSGNVVRDTRRERIERKQVLADLVSELRPRDGFLDGLLRSYDRAVRDPDNELVHLYEIKDALMKKFSGDERARLAIGMSATRWSRFKHLCNVEPLMQGRHRGQAGQLLRDATEGELVEARTAAREMLEGYLNRVCPT